MTMETPKCVERNLKKPRRSQEEGHFVALPEASLVEGWMTTGEPSQELIGAWPWGCTMGIDPPKLGYN